MADSYAFIYLIWFTFLSQDFPRLGHTVPFSLQELERNDPFQGPGKVCQVLVEVLKYFKDFLWFHKEFVLRQGFELHGKF